MSEASVPQGSGKHNDAPQPPTVADAAFCELVARDLGVKPATAKTAFLGEEASHVLGVAAWALVQVVVVALSGSIALLSDTISTTSATP